MNYDRDNILDAEFTRLPLPGHRVITIGIVRIARALGLRFAMRADEYKSEPQHTAMEGAAAAWMLDARTSLDEIRRAGEMTREAFFQSVVEPYTFELTPERLKLAEAELERTQIALDAAQYAIEAKPWKGSGQPAPLGK